MGWVSINLNASKQYACRNDEQEPLFGDSWAQAERKNITEPGASLRVCVWLREWFLSQAWIQVWLRFSRIESQGLRREVVRGRGSR